MKGWGIRIDRIAWKRSRRFRRNVDFDYSVKFVVMVKDRGQNFTAVYLVQRSEINTDRGTPDSNCNRRETRHI